MRLPSKIDTGEKNSLHFLEKKLLFFIFAIFNTLHFIFVLRKYYTIQSVDAANGKLYRCGSGNPKNCGNEKLQRTQV
jgi:hypothetical protein